MPYKNPLDLANNINPSSVVGTEVDVPHQKGIKGKITDEIGDTYEVEYTPQNGVTRREQFAKNEYNLPKPEEETRESVLAKIGGWANEKSQYDWDDGRSYLTSDESDYIKNAVNKYNITKKELQALHPHFFHPGSYGSYGIDENETLDQYKKRLGRNPSDEEYRGWITPKIKKSFDEYTAQGLDKRKIYDELYDAYGYEDLIRQAMGESAPAFGSKSKFAQKYPDRFAKLQQSKVYGKGRTAEDVDWDYIANILGLDLD